MSEDAMGHLFEQPTFNQGFVSVMFSVPVVFVVTGLIAWH